MEHLIPQIKKYLPEWNLKIHTEDDAFDFCEKQDIIAIETDLIDDLGEYQTRRDMAVILLHKFMSWRFRNTVFHHEIGHFILHPTICAKYSDQVTKRKIEKEANFVAAVALMPKWLVESKTLAEIADEYNYPRKLILFRKYIYDKYKI